MPCKFSVQEQVRAGREASYVRRCHALRLRSEYTVGQHSHDALSLLFILCPMASPRLIKAVHWHDYGERWMGDMPSPAKALDQALRARYEALEQRHLEDMGFDVPDLELEEQHWLRVIDVLELFLFLHDEQAAGNRHVEAALRGIHTALDKMDLPPSARRFFREFNWKRGDERL